MGSHQEEISDSILLEEAIEQRLQSLSPGYRKTNKTALTDFLEWVQQTQGIESLEAISPQVCRAYAKYLARRTAEGELAASTANLYYSFVRAWLSWCMQQDWTETNPATWDSAITELPEEKN